MALAFNGTTQYLLSSSSGAALAHPVSIHCRYKPAAHALVGVENIIITLIDHTEVAGANAFWLGYDNDGTRHMRIASADSVGFRVRRRDGDLVLGQWYSMLGVLSASAGPYTMYVNGSTVGDAGEASSTNPVPTNVVDMSIAAYIYNTSTVYRPAQGSVAEVGVWDVALTAAEAQLLSSGFIPAMVRPQNLVYYAPLIGRASPEIDIVSGHSLTLVASPTTDTHPRVFNWRARRNFGDKFKIRTISLPSLGPGIYQPPMAGLF